MTQVGILERAGIAMIHAYRFAFGWMPSSCRYEPTCSRYTEQAIEHSYIRLLGLRHLSSLEAGQGICGRR